MNIISQKILMGAAGAGRQEFFGAKFDTGIGVFGISPSDEICFATSAGNALYKYNDNNLRSLGWAKTFPPIGFSTGAGRGTVLFLPNGDIVHLGRFSELNGDYYVRGVQIATLDSNGDVQNAIRSSYSNKNHLYSPFSPTGEGVDNSGNIYIGMGGSDNSDLNVLRFTPSLNYIAASRITTTRGSSENQLGINGNGNYIHGYIRYGVNDRFDGFFQVHNNNGTALFGKRLRNDNGHFYCYGGHCIDDDNFVFPACFTGGNTNTTRGVFMLFNAAGQVQWQRQNILPVSDAEFVFWLRAVRLGPDGYFYIAGHMNNPVRPMVIKMDYSGNVIWQRRITFNETTTSTSYQLRNIHFDSEEAFYIISNNWLFKLPTDGSLIGSYSDFIYDDPNLGIEECDHTIVDSSSVTTRNYSNQGISPIGEDITPLDFNPFVRM